MTLSEGFWLGETAVAQAMWKAVLGNNPSHLKGPDLPVENVYWDDLVSEFLPTLNEQIAGLDASLPTEAQWEYACQAGTQTPFHFGEESTPARAIYNGNGPWASQIKGEYRGKTAPVNEFEPNAWGLYQMHGNVLEWCRDGVRK